MSLRACVVIPAYNAAKTLTGLLQRLKPLGLPTVVVNDGSTDETAPVAIRSGSFVISHLANRGKGAALRSGFDYAVKTGYEAVITLDSDGQHDPQDIPQLLDAAALNGHHIIIGQRTQDLHRMPLVRRWTNRAMSWIVSRLTRQSIPDSQCGFRVIHRDVLTQVSLTSRRFDLETEILLAAAGRGWRVRSVPIRTIYERHGSHIHPISDGLRFFRLVLRYLFKPRAFRHGA